MAGFSFCTTQPASACVELAFRPSACLPLTLAAWDEWAELSMSVGPWDAALVTLQDLHLACFASLTAPVMDLSCAPSPSSRVPCILSQRSLPSHLTEGNVDWNAWTSTFQQTLQTQMRWTEFHYLLSGMPCLANCTLNAVITFVEVGLFSSCTSK